MRKVYGLRLRHPATHREWNAHTDLDLKDRDGHRELSRHLKAMAQRHDQRDRKVDDFASEYELDVLDIDNNSVLLTWTTVGTDEQL